MNNGKIKIFLFISLALYFVLALSGQIGIVHPTSHSNISKICSIETSTRSESPTPLPKLSTAKPRPSVLKLEIQTCIIRVLNPFPRVEQFVVIRTINLYRLNPQFSFVRYLPRDPPTA
jgi:hypothetical protein